MNTEVRYPQYRDDPVGFVENVLGAAGKPYSKQREMLEAAAKSRRVSVAGANGCGKGWALARLILWWLETRAQAKVVVLSSTNRQVREVLWQELAAVCDAAATLSAASSRRASTSSRRSGSPSASPRTTLTTSTASTRPNSC